MLDRNGGGEGEEGTFLTKVIQTILVTVGVAAIAHVTTSIRLPDLISSTKVLIAELGRINWKQVCLEIVKIYFIYILFAILLVLCVFYITKKIVTSRSSLPSNFCSNYSKRYLVPCALFLLAFYILNVFLASQARSQYTNFYADFKAGGNGHEFMGYQNYHFTNHIGETRLRLEFLREQAKDREEQALVEGVRNLVKKQDKSLSAFRSYLANYSLIFKLIHIGHYSLAFLGTIALLVALSLHNCFFKQEETQSHYGSIEEHQPEERSDESLMDCPEANSKRKKCMSACYILFISITLSALILTSFVLGDIFLELKIGHPYNNNIEQKQVCSFHKHIGGFYINIDYQNQLELAREFQDLEKRFRKDSGISMEMVDELQSYLKLYVSLCEILQPYYLRHKQLQQTLCELFYRHFYAFIYICWLYSRVVKELKINSAAETE